MKTIFSILLLICALSISQLSFGQSYFDIDNQTQCTVWAQAIAYTIDDEGDCPSNCYTITYNTGWKSVPPGSWQLHSGVGLSGQWGAVWIRESSTGTAQSEDGDCISPSGSVDCNPDVSVIWVDCNNAIVN